MTYCLAMNLDDGLVFCADSRTNAGVDNISRFEKMRVFANEGDRVIVTLSAGNLSMTQNALSWLDQRARFEESATSLWNVGSMFYAAQVVGEAMREVQRRDGDWMRQNNIDASASFIVGGQIAGEEPRLFLVYTEGNFIESSEETRFFQSGEMKYGKPILDRVLTKELSLPDASKLALISFDSTLRSNISVGPPLYLLAYQRDSLRTDGPVRVDEDDPYFSHLREQWADGLRDTFAGLPTPPWY